MWRPDADSRETHIVEAVPTVGLAGMGARAEGV